MIMRHRRTWVEICGLVRLEEQNQERNEGRPVCQCSVAQEVTAARRNQWLNRVWAVTAEMV